MHKKGFTLIELLAVIVVLGVVLLLAMPSILDSINASRDSSYKILIGNIKTAAETYYQECEYGDLSDKNKYGNYACAIKNNTINTTIGALANTGILKVPADDSGDLIVKDPRDKEDNTKDDNKDKGLNACGIIITKEVDDNFKVIYKITEDTNKNKNVEKKCPTTEDLQWGSD